MNNKKLCIGKATNLLYIAMFALAITGCSKKNTEPPASENFAPDENQQKILKAVKEYPDFVAKVKEKTGVCNSPIPSDCFGDVSKMVVDNYGDQAFGGSASQYNLETKEKATYRLGYRLSIYLKTFGADYKDSKLEGLDKLAKAMTPTVGSNINAFVTSVMPASVEIATIDATVPVGYTKTKDNMEALNKVIAIISFVLDYRKNISQKLENAVVSSSYISEVIAWLKSIKSGYKTNKYEPASSNTEDKLKVTKDGYTLDVAALKVDDLVALLEELKNRTDEFTQIQSKMEGITPMSGADPNNPNSGPVPGQGNGPTPNSEQPEW